MVYQCYLPVHMVMEDSQTSGISGGKRSTVEASFCFVGISTGLMFRAIALVQFHSFCGIWDQKGELVTTARGTSAEVMWNPMSCSAIRIAQ